jgi:hypothetical protein
LLASPPISKMQPGRPRSNGSAARSRNSNPRSLPGTVRTCRTGRPRPSIIWSNVSRERRSG